MARRKYNTKKKTTSNKVKKKKPTANQQAYQKELNRIKSFIRRANKKGFEFKEDILPVKPKHIHKKHIEQLKQLTSKELYGKSHYTVNEDDDRFSDEYAYGEVISGVEALKLRRKTGYRKGRERKKQIEASYTQEYYDNYEYDYDYEFTSSSKVIVNNFLEELNSFHNNLTAPLKQLIKSLVHVNGEESVAYMLQNLPERFHECLARLQYDSKSAVSDYSTQIIEYMPDMTDEYKKELMERFEYNELGYEIDED